MVRKRKAKLIKRSRYQTGKSNKKVDQKRTALPPGVRRSKSGKKYTERRKNRSDKNKRKRL